MSYRNKNFKWYIVAVLFIATVFIWYAVFTENHSNKLIVAFLDIGQGDSVFIQAPNGNQVLVDGGPNKSVLRELGKVMPFYDRSIDVVIATHPDKDHVGGLPSVLQKFKVGVLIEDGVFSNTSVYKALTKIYKKEDVRKIIARRGQRIILDKGIYIDILFPDRNTTGWETNTASIVARLVYGDTSFLLTGDSPQKIEKYLVSLDGNRLSSNVLKLGHHGSRTSSSKIFLSTVKPQLAIISAGLNNRYGHPHKEVMDLLKELKIPSLITFNKGTIIVDSDGRNIKVEK